MLAPRPSSTAKVPCLHPFLFLLFIPFSAFKYPCLGDHQENPPRADEPASAPSAGMDVMPDALPDPDDVISALRIMIESYRAFGYNSYFSTDHWRRVLVEIARGLGLEGDETRSWRHGASDVMLCHLRQPVHSAAPGYIDFQVAVFESFLNFFLLLGYCHWSS